MKIKYILVAAAFVLLLSLPNLFSSKNVSLDGAIVLTGQPVSTVDSVRIFLISASAISPIETLFEQYERSSESFETAVNEQRVLITRLRKEIKEEETLMKLYSGANQNDPAYVKEVEILNALKLKLETADLDYRSNRKVLIDAQTAHNREIGIMFDNHILLKTETSPEGFFEFPKVPKGEYLIYAMRIMAGDKDVTTQPGGIYYQQILEQQNLTRFSWLLPIELDEDTAVELNRENQRVVFK